MTNQYERYDLVSAYEGNVPQKVLRQALSGYRCVELIPPFERRIAFVAEYGYPILEWDVDAKTPHHFLGAYKFVGLISEDEVQALRADPKMVVELSGEFSVVKAAAGAGYPFIRGLVGTMKQYLNDGAFILLEEGQQDGDFNVSWSSNGTGIVKDPESPVHRVTASSPEQALAQIAKQHPNASIVEVNTEAGVIDMLLKMSDSELLRHCSGKIRRSELKSYRALLAKRRLQLLPR